MRLQDLKDVEPILTSKEFQLLKTADKIHEDPTVHANVEQMRLITRLMFMGLLRRDRNSDEIQVSSYR